MDRKLTAYYVLYQPSSNNCAAVVSYMANYFKQNGAYFTDTKDLCKGDIVFFQNDAGLSHVGICVDWGDTWFNTVEGNKGDEVKLCGYYYNQVGGYVAGFAHPRYNENCTAEDAIEYAFSQIGYRESGNNWNKYADQLDEVDYFAGCGKKQNLPWCAIFICAVMYNAYKANEDPQPTPEPTVKTVNVELDILKKGSTGGQVKTIQALLNGFIGSNLAIDGIFGSKTEQGVKDYQKSRGLTADGVVGAETWTRILK